jgi:hypothetical protein
VLIHAADIVRESARLVADRIAPHLLTQLESAYGPGWLERINATLAQSGRRPGSGLDDDVLCLTVFAYDEAFGSVHKTWRSMARELLGLVDRASAGRKARDYEADRATAIAHSFAREWADPEDPGPPDEVVDETDDNDDGYGQSKWFTLSFSRPRTPDAWGWTYDPGDEASDFLWESWQTTILEYLRPHLEDGWTPFEPPGPEHLEVQLRRRASLTGARWEAYLFKFRLLLTRTR